MKALCLYGIIIASFSQSRTFNENCHVKNIQGSLQAIAVYYSMHASLYVTVYTKIPICTVSIVQYR